MPVTQWYSICCVTAVSLVQNLTLVSVDATADNVDDNGTDGDANGTDGDANETGVFIPQDK